MATDMRASLEHEASFANPRFPDQHDNGRPVLAECGVDGFLNCFEFRRPARKRQSPDALSHAFGEWLVGRR